jgi:hypothetical protein
MGGQASPTVQMNHGDTLFAPTTTSNPRLRKMLFGKKRREKTKAAAAEKAKIKSGIFRSTQ